MKYLVIVFFCVSCKSNTTKVILIDTPVSYKNVFIEQVIDTIHKKKVDSIWKARYDNFKGMQNADTLYRKDNFEFGRNFSDFSDGDLKAVRVIDAKGAFLRIDSCHGIK